MRCSIGAFCSPVRDPVLPRIIKKTAGHTFFSRNHFSPKKLLLLLSRLQSRLSRIHAEFQTDQCSPGPITSRQRSERAASTFNTGIDAAASHKEKLFPMRQPVSGNWAATAKTRFAIRSLTEGLARFRRVSPTRAGAGVLGSSLWV